MSKKMWCAVIGGAFAVVGSLVPFLKTSDQAAPRTSVVKKTDDSGSKQKTEGDNSPMVQSRGDKSPAIVNGRNSKAEVVYGDSRSPKVTSSVNNSEVKTTVNNGSTYVDAGTKLPANSAAPASSQERIKLLIDKVQATPPAAAAPTDPEQPELNAVQSSFPSGARLADLWRSEGWTPEVKVRVARPGEPSANEEALLLTLGLLMREIKSLKTEVDSLHRQSELMSQNLDIIAQKEGFQKVVAR